MRPMGPIRPMGRMRPKLSNGLFLPGVGLYEVTNIPKCYAFDTERPFKRRSNLKRDRIHLRLDLPVGQATDREEFRARELPGLHRVYPEDRRGRRAARSSSRSVI